MIALLALAISIVPALVATAALALFVAVTYVPVARQAQRSSAAAAVIRGR